MLYDLCSALGSWKNPWEGYTLECECDGDRIACVPKSKWEEALNIKFFPDCIAGCECTPRAEVD